MFTILEQGYLGKLRKRLQKKRCMLYIVLLICLYLRISVQLLVLVLSTTKLVPIFHWFATKTILAAFLLVTSFAQFSVL